MFNWFKKTAVAVKVSPEPEVAATQGVDSINQSAISESEALKNRGNAHLNNGRLEDAADCYRQAIERNPHYAEAYSNLGYVFEAQGNLDEAVALYRKAIEFNPNLLAAHQNLGFALLNLGQSDAAEESLRRVIALAPEHASALQSLGAIAAQRGDFAHAETLLRRALELQPDYVDAHNNLGILLKQTKRLPEAEASYRRALELQPDNASTHYNLGNLLMESKRLSEAEASYRHALELQPDYAEAHSNLGNLFMEAKRLPEAEASYRRALELNPDYAEAYFKLGNLLMATNRLSEAEASYRRALELKPDYADAHYNLGTLFMEANRVPEAKASFLRALELNPDFAEAYCNLGAVLHKYAQPDDAVEAFHRALEIKPDYAEAHSNLGVILQELGQLDEAEVSLRRALQIKPDYAEAHNNLLFTLNYHPDMSAEDIYRAYQEYDALRCIPLRSTWRAHSNDKNPGRRLRVGYVSPDFRRHSCTSFLEPLLAHHDKTQVEVYAYAELSKEDDVTARYKNYVDHWIPTKGMSDEALAERVRSDGIDILVELAGHTANNRLLTFARKPAPVSLSWLGYGYTTGLGAIDYYFTDEACVPAGSEGLFAEQPWRIATPAWIYRPTVGMGEVNGLPAQERGYITFGTLTRSVRINHRTIRVWAEILKAVPNSRLVIDSSNFKDPAMQERMAARFAEHGITRDRLEIGFHSPPWDTLRGIDIGLDCFPHNSGTTLFETLYMGVPYITLAGRPSVGRLGSSILQGAGHPEWIAESEDDYAAKAVDLASDVIRLSEIRSTLRNQMESSPLRDEAGFARKVEEAYRRMWQGWCEKSDRGMNRGANERTGTGNDERGI
jgi:predicted O-linked N-acetylglucosamine transferase (SPINDLY family)